MSQNKLAGFLQGNNELASFTQSCSKENLLCPETSPGRTGRHPRKTTNRPLHPSWQRILHYSAKHWVTGQMRWNTRCTVTVTVNSCAICTTGRFSTKKNIWVLYCIAATEFVLIHEVTSLFSYINFPILSTFHYQNFFGFSLLKLHSPAKSAFENRLLGECLNLREERGKSLKKTA